MGNLKIEKKHAMTEGACANHLLGANPTVLSIFVGETGKNVKKLINKVKDITKHLHSVEIDVNNKATILNDTFLKANLHELPRIFMIFDSENSDDVKIVKEIIRQKDKINSGIKSDDERLTTWGFTYKDNENTKDIDHCVVSKDINSIFETTFRMVLAEAKPGLIGMDFSAMTNLFHVKRVIKMQLNKYDSVDDFDISKVDLDFDKIVPCFLSIVGNYDMMELDWVYKLASDYRTASNDANLLFCANCLENTKGLETAFYYSEK